LLAVSCFAVDMQSINSSICKFIITYLCTTVKYQQELTNKIVE